MSEKVHEEIKRNIEEIRKSAEEIKQFSRFALKIKKEVEKTVIEEGYHFVKCVVRQIFDEYQLEIRVSKKGSQKVIYNGSIKSWKEGTGVIYLIEHMLQNKGIVRYSKEYLLWDHTLVVEFVIKNWVWR